MGTRPFMVAELGSNPAWTGKTWWVACKTAKGAEAAFRRRVADNLAIEGHEGFVVAYERATGHLLLWTSQVKNPKRVLYDYGIVHRL